VELVLRAQRTGKGTFGGWKVVGNLTDSVPMLIALFHNILGPFFDFLDVNIKGFMEFVADFEFIITSLFVATNRDDVGVAQTEISP
jgi:hypothetical protein